MAVEYFLKLEGIDGESTDSHHKGEIQLLSFSWGEQNASAHSPSGGAAAGRVSFQDFHFTARTSKASPKLFLNCASGAHIRSALLTCVDFLKETEVAFLKLEFSEVLVSSYSVSGAPGADSVNDEVTLNFAKIEYQYAPIRSLGGQAGWITEAWSLTGNKV